MLRNEFTLFIKSPPERVFDYLASREKRDAWTQGPMGSWLDTGDPVESVPGVRLVFQTGVEGGYVSGRFTLEAMEGGTLLTYNQETEIRGLTDTLLKPVASFQIFQKHKADFVRLQRILESST